MGQLGRIGIAALNLTLFVLCASLAERALTPVLAEWIDPPSDEFAALPRGSGPTQRGWSDRQVILERNLFKASVVESAALEPTEEELEETKLPLELLGTAATEPATLSIAAILDTRDRKHRIVRVGDELDAQARVVRIEHRRVVLRNGARLEELALQEEDSPQRGSSASSRKDSSASARAAARTKRASTKPRAQSASDREGLADRVRRLSENRFALKRDDVREAAGDSANLFSQARILPRYEDGEMVGLQLNAIKPNSLFERIGIANGDTVTELNGIQVTSPEQSASLLRELAEATEFTVMVRGSDGEERTLNYELEDGE
jgi:general secretion pathway protein C